ncbi:MAG: hypothetical protein JJU28_01000 [Cyclobacteriaceae bacterium]|nr:hypothetical protein [Cyclobacteriaceae bacterium]
MRTLNWCRTNWIARNFVFSIGQEIIGQLTFHSSWNFNAVYTDKETKIRFAQTGFWDRSVLITKDGEKIGIIKSGFFIHPTLTLVTGEKFILSSNIWGRDVNWKTKEGKTIIQYKQTTLSSMEKGIIKLNDSLTIDIEKLLISSGLFIRQYIHKRAALMIAIAIPIIVASNR